MSSDWIRFTKPEAPAGVPKHSKETNQGSQPDAINTIHFGQLQNELLRRLHQLLELKLKGADLVAGGDPALAANDGHISQLLSFQNQLHHAGKVPYSGPTRWISNQDAFHTHGFSEIGQAKAIMRGLIS